MMGGILAHCSFTCSIWRIGLLDELTQQRRRGPSRLRHPPAQWRERGQARRLHTGHANADAIRMRLISWRYCNPLHNPVMCTLFRENAGCPGGGVLRAEHSLEGRYSHLETASLHQPPRRQESLSLSLFVFDICPRCRYGIPTHLLRGPIHARWSSVWLMPCWQRVAVPQAEA